MGFVEKDHNLTGNSLMLDGLVISWDETEEVQLDLEKGESGAAVVAAEKPVDSGQNRDRKAENLPKR